MSGDMHTPVCRRIAAVLTLALITAPIPALAQSCRSSSAAFIDCVKALHQSGKFTLQDLDVPAELPGRVAPKIGKLFSNFGGPKLPGAEGRTKGDTKGGIGTQGKGKGWGSGDKGGGQDKGGQDKGGIGNQGKGKGWGKGLGKGGGEDKGGPGQGWGKGKGKGGGGDKGGGKGPPSPPPKGITPQVPGGVVPPIATLPPPPPEGITPGLPGGVTPPIAPAPPSPPPKGVMPQLPGGVVPPIATLPQPPPEGITPGLPGGVTPPIAPAPPPPPPSPPPKGVMPQLPGGVVPPIATLPRPPPEGLTPGLPGGVTPPIAPAPPWPPPGGVTPTVPGGVVPPIATLPRPPPDGLTPGMPGGTVTPPGAQLRPAARQRERQLTRSDVPCPDPRSPQTQRDDCPDTQFQQAPPQRGDTGVPLTPGRDTAVPLTPGRDIGVETVWNAWTEGTFVDLSDRRHGLDNKGRTGTATFGLDRKLTDEIVVGASIGVQKSWSHGFSGFTSAESDGITIGPYVAVRLSPNWAADVSLSYADNQRDARIISLRSQSSLQAYTGSATLHGQYVVNEWYLRPKFTVNYTRNVSGAHDLAGTVLGLPLSLHFPTAISHFGLAEAYGEVSRLFSFPNGVYMIPYLELAVHYAFDRPNNGEMLTGDLRTFIPSAWVGSVRSGARMQLPGNALVEASVGYLSFGQNDLNVWEGKLRLSVGF